MAPKQRRAAHRAGRHLFKVTCIERQGAQIISVTEMMDLWGILPPGPCGPFPWAHVGPSLGLSWALPLSACEPFPLGPCGPCPWALVGPSLGTLSALPLGTCVPVPRALVGRSLGNLCALPSGPSGPFPWTLVGPSLGLLWALPLGPCMPWHALAYASACHGISILIPLLSNNTEMIWPKSSHHLGLSFTHSTLEASEFVTDNPAPYKRETE